MAVNQALSDKFGISIESDTVTQTTAGGGRASAIETNIRIAQNLSQQQAEFLRSKIESGVWGAANYADVVKKENGEYTLVFQNLSTLPEDKLADFKLAVKVIKGKEGAQFFGPNADAPYRDDPQDMEKRFQKEKQDIKNLEAQKARELEGRELAQERAQIKQERAQKTVDEQEKIRLNSVKRVTEPLGLEVQDAELTTLNNVVHKYGERIVLPQSFTMRDADNLIVALTKENWTRGSIQAEEKEGRISIVVQNGQAQHITAAEERGFRDAFNTTKEKYAVPTAPALTEADLSGVAKKYIELSKKEIDGTITNEDKGALLAISIYSNEKILADKVLKKYKEEVESTPATPTISPETARENLQKDLKTRSDIIIANKDSVHVRDGVLFDRDLTGEALIDKYTNQGLDKKEITAAIDKSDKTAVVTPAPVVPVVPAETAANPEKIAEEGAKKAAEGVGQTIQGAKEEIQKSLKKIIEDLPVEPKPPLANDPAPAKKPSKPEVAEPAKPAKVEAPNMDVPMPPIFPVGPTIDKLRAPEAKPATVAPATSGPTLMAPEVPKEAAAPVVKPVPKAAVPPAEKSDRENIAELREREVQLQKKIEETNATAAAIEAANPSPSAAKTTPLVPAAPIVDAAEKAKLDSIVAVLQNADRGQTDFRDGGYYNGTAADKKVGKVELREALHGAGYDVFMKDSVQAITSKFDLDGDGKVENTEVDKIAKAAKGDKFDMTYDELAKTLQASGIAVVKDNDIKGPVASPVAGKAADKGPEGR